MRAQVITPTIRDKQKYREKKEEKKHSNSSTTAELPNSKSHCEANAAKKSTQTRESSEWNLKKKKKKHREEEEEGKKFNPNMSKAVSLPFGNRRP